MATNVNAERRTLFQVIHNVLGEHRSVGEEGDQESSTFCMIVDLAEVLSHEDLTTRETYKENA